MDNLRLILILIGLVILAVIWFLHQPRGGRRPGATRRESQRVEPDLNAANAVNKSEPSSNTAGEPHQTQLPTLAEDAESEAEMPDANGAELSSSNLGDERREPVWSEPVSAAKEQPTEQSRSKSAPAAAESDFDAPKVVTLYIRSRESRRISGVSLLDAAIKAGLRFGDMNIFHRRQQGADQPVFSMANLMAPGSFDPSEWNLFETPGVTLFMTLPGPLSALDAWDAMLATSQRLAELLDAELLDDAQCLITRQRIAQIREDMREYDRKHEGFSGD